jgi:hypothetical protein
MNTAPADSTAQPASEIWLAEPKPPRAGWPQSKLILFIVFALAAHIGFIFIFGTKKPVVPRAVTNAPQLQLADNSSELVALDDPTLFALPHANDYATPFWQSPPAVQPPNFRWTEAPRYLTLTHQNLGATFIRFVQTNPPVPFVLNFQPPPPFAEFLTSAVPPLPQNSTVQIAGDLAQRSLLKPILAPDLPYNDVIAPSRVQVLVDAAGSVISTVLLPADNSADALGHWDFADQRALTLARAARFTAAPQLTFGELIFNWHTIPTTTTNAIP